MPKQTYVFRLGIGDQTYTFTVQDDDGRGAHVEIGQSFSPANTNLQDGRIVVRIEHGTVFMDQLRQALTAAANPRGSRGMFGQKTSRWTRTLATERQQYPRAYEAWTDDEDEELRGLLEDGLLLRDIATRLQRRPSAVQSRMHKLGLDGASPSRDIS